MDYKIDAANKILGRLASEIATLLRGKNDPRFDPSRSLGNTITVSNVDKIRVTGKKLDQKLYRRHSGYHGGLKEEKLQEIIKRDASIALRRAVLGMLPKNKLRSRFIKNLIFVEKGK